MSGLTRTLVVALDAAGQAVPLARDASVDVRVRVNSPLPPNLSIGWAERVAAGPWVGPYESAFGSSLRRVPSELPTAMAVIPLRTSTAMLGAIVVCTQAVDGITFLAGRLPVLESFGAVASALLAPGHPRPPASRRSPRRTRGRPRRTRLQAGLPAGRRTCLGPDRRPRSAHAIPRRDPPGSTVRRRRGGGPRPGARVGLPDGRPRGSARAARYRLVEPQRLAGPAARARCGSANAWRGESARWCSR